MKSQITEAINNTLDYTFICNKAEQEPTSVIHGTLIYLGLFTNRLLLNEMNILKLTLTQTTALACYKEPICQEIIPNLCLIS